MGYGRGDVIIEVGRGFLLFRLLKFDLKQSELPSNIICHCLISDQ